MTKTTELLPLLVTVRDALPERIRARIDLRDCREDHLHLPHIGWIELRYDYGRDPQPEGIQIHFTGDSSHLRPRRYPIRKDGTINVAKIKDLVAPLFDAREKFLKDYAKRQAESDARFAEAKRLGPIVFKKVRTGQRYRKQDVEHYAGGFKLVHRRSKREADIWAESEDTVSGAIPFSDLPISKLNELLKLVGAM
jgi:hypothetical protein